MERAKATATSWTVYAVAMGLHGFERSLIANPFFGCCRMC